MALRIRTWLQASGQAGHGGSLDGPVLDLQPTHSPKFAFIVCNQCQACNHGMRSDPEIVVSDHLPFRFQLRPNRSVCFGRRFRQGERGQQMHELPQPLKRRNPLLALGGAIEQLAIGNDRKRGFPGTELTESAQNFFRPFLPVIWEAWKPKSATWPVKSYHWPRPLA